MGNLADELDQLDDDEDGYFEGESMMSAMESEAGAQGHKGSDAEAEGKEPRDSGIDVTYRSRTGSPAVKNFSKPFALAGKPPDEQEEEEQEDKLGPDLEDAMNSIARMTSSTTSTPDPLIPRTIALLQDLGNQALLETGAQRLTTSTNSMTSHLLAQSKSIQALAMSLYSPFTFSAPLDPEIIEDTAPLVEALLKELPVPDTAALQGLQKLERETGNVIQTLSQLTDTIQMGKQITNTAARHLRTTQTMVADLRREREKADLARHELAKADVAEKLRERRCASECEEVVKGFEEFCDALRSSLEQDGGGGGGGESEVVAAAA